VDTFVTPPNNARFIGPEAIPYIEWDNHGNDLLDYGGENGTIAALEQAKKNVEMMEYDPGYRYGDFYCGTYLVEEDMRVEAERKANGTWVEPIYKKKIPWECSNWDECWRAWPWKWHLGYGY
jgi:hypothetical protein